MLKNVSNQWKAEIIDAVGINEFTDMYIQAIRQFVREDLFTTEIPESKFDDVLENEILDNIIAKLMNFVYQNDEDLKKLTISQKILVCRAVLNNIDIPMDFKKINYESLDNDIVAITKGEKQIATLMHDFFKDENIVKATCRKLGITYKELGDEIGYSESAISNASRGTVSDAMKKAIELYLKTLEQEKELQKLTTLRTTLKSILE